MRGVDVKAALAASVAAARGQAAVLGRFLQAGQHFYEQRRRPKVLGRAQQEAAQSLREVARERHKGLPEGRISQRLQRLLGERPRVAEAQGRGVKEAQAAELYQCQQSRRQTKPG